MFLYQQCLALHALKVRALLSPFSLKDTRCKGLNWEYNHIVDKVFYLTSYDLVRNFECMPRFSRRSFLDFLCDERVIVTPDWESMDASVTRTLYDHGLRCPPHDRHLYKRESDASLDPVSNKARIGIILWNDDQVVWSEVLEEVDCNSSSVNGEALAMCLLLKRAIQLGIRPFA